MDTSERRVFLEEYVCDWNFSPLDLDELDLVQCVYIMLDQTFEQLTELNSLRMKKGKYYKNQVRVTQWYLCFPLSSLSSKNRYYVRLYL